MIYIDHLRFYKGKGYFAHMMSDSSLDELHYFAKNIALNRCWFENNPKHYHYDVPAKYYRAALEKGAYVVTSKQLIKLCKKPT